MSKNTKTLTHLYAQQASLSKQQGELSNQISDVISERKAYTPKPGDRFECDMADGHPTLKMMGIYQVAEITNFTPSDVICVFEVGCHPGTAGNYMKYRFRKLTLVDSICEGDILYDRGGNQLMKFRRMTKRGIYWVAAGNLSDGRAVSWVIDGNVELATADQIAQYEALKPPLLPFGTKVRFEINGRKGWGRVCWDKPDVVGDYLVSTTQLNGDPDWHFINQKDLTVL